ncbi:MAG: amino acid permease [Phycisphaeraceae bacterium]|nr:amino acid permease [Phycisphaeraceae bacterium]MBX3366264.1 amino acid permease [Phycisphaeraceae bacterium]
MSDLPMLVTESRPRNLKWFHAGPLLYGDWGTSRLYVLGLAFAFTGPESVVYMVAIGVLMAAVAWAYAIVCRSFPDGGGVYTSARQISPIASVVGATLLLCGYIITAVISVVEALHYFGIPDGPWLATIAIVTLVFVGLVNWLGARSAGTFALVIAFAALGVSGLMAVMSVPYLPDGLSRVSIDLSRSTWSHWTAFTQIVLALAGVEAVANMTGLMRRPVERTAKRTIIPVLLEVVLLNVLFAIVATSIFTRLPELQGLPSPIASIDSQTLHQLEQTAPASVQKIEEIKNTSMKLIAETVATNAIGPSGGLIFGKVAAVVFALLLLSATNTAIMAMVSVLFSMAQDGELPRSLRRLNYSGVPSVGLVVSLLACIGVVLIERRPERLAELYIIGVCGAITVTILSCAIGRKISIKPWERGGMWSLGLFLLAVTLTIVGTKLNATAFAGVVIAGVLVTRATLRRRARAMEPPAEPTDGWLAQVKRQPARLDSGRPRIMLAARGHSQQAYAVELARKRGAVLFAIFVRAVRVLDLQPGQVPRIEDDREAQEALGSAAVLASQAGVPFVPIYVTSTEIVEEILDYTATFGCDTLIMGKSRRSLFARTIEGDVVGRIAASLPKEIDLILRSGDPAEAARGVSRSSESDDDSSDDRDAPGPT